MLTLWPVQQALYAALSAAPATYPTFDAVPQGTAPPYIVIGEFNVEPDGELFVASADAMLQLHTWSAAAGKKESHAILDFIRSRLDGFDVPGAWACTEERNEVIEDRSSTAASRLYHGVARYRIRASA